MYVFLFGFDKNRVTYEARFIRTRLGVLNESDILSEIIQKLPQRL